MKNKATNIDYEELTIQTGLSLNEIVAKRKSSAMRTTFRLTDYTIEALSEISKETKLKDYIDELGEFLNQQHEFTNVVILKAKEMDKKDLNKCEKKSFAISKKTVKTFNNLSKKNNIVRDVFINQSIIIYHHLIKTFKEQDAKKVKRAQIKIIEFWGKSEKLQRELFELLGNDHQVAKEFGNVNAMFENLDLAIDEYLESGKPIELF